MKIVIALFVAIAMLAGCANQPLIAPMSPAEIANQINTVICPGSAAILIDLKTPGLITNAALAAKLPDVQKDVDAVCADGAALNSASLQTLFVSAQPIILAIVQATPGPYQEPAIAAIGAAQLLEPILVAQIKTLEAAKPVPTIAPVVAPVVIPAPAAAA